MKNIKIGISWDCVIFLLITALGSVCFADRGVRKHVEFDFGWKFIKTDVQGAQKTDFDDSGWDHVQVPHDWSIEGPLNQDNPSGKAGGFFPGGIGWYRKHFQLAKADRDRKIFIQFDGIYQNSEVWINGHSLGRRPYGYVGFQHDLTPYVFFDKENVIAVRVDNDQANCRWYSGSGIYRHVWLTVTNKVHVGHLGTYITTPDISENKVVVKVRTRIKNTYSQPKTCSVTTTIRDSDGKVVAEVTTPKSIAAQGEFEFDQQLDVADAKLWSIDNPTLYRSHTTVKVGQNICDEYETPFGIREIRFDKDKGFLLNGQSVKMKGVCIHHDAGCLGAAVPDRALERRLEVLKSIGCNAIRTSHNPPAPELLDLCDRMGFVVIDEMFDNWKAAPWFPEWGQQYLIDILRRDRNHPCVVLWSVGNELEHQGTPGFKQTLKTLAKLVRQQDPTRPITCGLRPGTGKTGWTPLAAKTIADLSKIIDVFCCNYQEQWFEDYRKEYPEIVIIASESFPFYRGKGDKLKAFYPVNPWLDAEKNNYVAGTFYWTGIDYLGEARAGWPFHGWNCGLIDTCGFPRPVSYLQKSFWTKEPMVHIAVMDDSLDVEEPVKSHWDWPKMASHWNLPLEKGKSVKVVTFTNCQTVELVLNGRSVGTKQLADFPDKMITWQVPYQPGIIEARGIRSNQVACSHQLQTAGRPTQICLFGDRTTIQADSKDLCHVEVRVTDEKGIIVPNANNLIRFEIKGNGKIIGVDNGDLTTSDESYKARQRKAFHGKAFVVLQSSTTPGEIILKAYAEGLKGANMSIESK
jgi:beta-galactosidase